MPSPFDNPNILADYQDGKSLTVADSGMQVVQQPRIGDQLAALLNLEAQQAAVARRPRARGAIARTVPGPQLAGGSEGSRASLQGKSRPRKRPVFLRTMTGPGVVPGNVRASAFDPGANFAGWEYMDDIPRNAILREQD